MARRTLSPTADRGAKVRNALLWIVQGVLAALFLSAASAKLSMPVNELVRLFGLPAPFMRFIGVAEGLGGLGLLLPGLLRIQRRLTPVAASGLVVIMVGAVTTTIPRLGVAPAVLPLLAGVFAACVVLGRRSWWTAGSERARLRPAEVLLRRRGVSV